jgi:hypothetical protein
MWALRVVVPQLKLNQPKSHFFFLHLVQMYGRDYERAARELTCLSGDKATLELGTQVSVNSVICEIKASRCKKALNFTAIALAFYLLSLFPFAIVTYASSHQTGPQQRCKPPLRRIDLPNPAKYVQVVPSA